MNEEIADLPLQTTFATLRPGAKNAFPAVNPPPLESFHGMVLASSPLWSIFYSTSSP
jgi:hypothetical protein